MSVSRTSRNLFFLLGLTAAQGKSSDRPINGTWPTCPAEYKSRIMTVETACEVPQYLVDEVNNRELHRLFSMCSQEDQGNQEDSFLQAVENNTAVCQLDPRFDFVVKEFLQNIHEDNIDNLKNIIRAGRECFIGQSAMFAEFITGLWTFAVLNNHFKSANYLFQRFKKNLNVKFNDSLYPNFPEASPITYAASKGYLEQLEMMMQAFKKNAAFNVHHPAAHPVFAAAVAHQSQALRKLYQLGLDFNSGDQPPAFLLVQMIMQDNPRYYQKRLEALRLLLNEGADVNHFYTRKLSTEKFEDENVKPENRVDRQRTLLQIAAEHSNLDVARVLLEAKASPYKVGRNSLPATHIAFKKKDVAMLALLCEPQYRFDPHLQYRKHDTGKVIKSLFAILVDHESKIQSPLDSMTAKLMDYPHMHDLVDQVNAKVRARQSEKNQKNNVEPRSKGWNWTQIIVSALTATAMTFVKYREQMDFVTNIQNRLEERRAKAAEAAEQQKAEAARQAKIDKRKAEYEARRAADVARLRAQEREMKEKTAQRATGGDEAKAVTATVPIQVPSGTKKTKKPNSTHKKSGGRNSAKIQAELRHAEKQSKRAARNLRLLGRQQRAKEAEERRLIELEQQRIAEEEAQKLRQAELERQLLGKGLLADLNSPQSPDRSITPYAPKVTLAPQSLFAIKGNEDAVWRSGPIEGGWSAAAAAAGVPAEVKLEPIADSLYDRLDLIGASQDELNAFTKAQREKLLPRGPR